jgi:integrase
MARKTTDVVLTSKTARLKLKVQANPHFRLIQEGHALGYRRIANKAGTWVARRSKPKMAFLALGSADDFLPADGDKTLTYPQALTRAQEWFVKDTSVEPLTVQQAMANYVQFYQDSGKKALKETEFTIGAHILPTLGDKEVAQLKTTDITAWLQKVANAPPRRRRGAASKKQKVNPKAATVADPRARRASANRILTVLKAALNLAFNTGVVDSDVAWRRVKPFEKVDAPKIQWLTDAEIPRLVEACPADLRAIVYAALLTGADYGELSSATVSSVSLADDRLNVSGKRGSRIISLSAEAKSFFATAIEGKGAGDRLFLRASGDPWGKSNQFRPLREACRVAKITRPPMEPAISFHILRHTYATRILRRGMSMHQLSKQLGHKSVVITAKHYAHVLQDDVAESVKKLSGDLGVAPSPAPGAMPG